MQLEHASLAAWVQQEHGDMMMIGMVSCEVWCWFGLIWIEIGLLMEDYNWW